MSCIAWDGPAPPAEVRRALRGIGASIAEAPAEAAFTVIATARGRRVPAAPRRSDTDPPRWIWWCGDPPDAAAQAEAVRRGAYDVIAAHAEGATARLVARARELVEMEAEAPPPESAGFVARSAAGRAVLAQLAKAARTSMPVLLTGETGTGKEVAARLVHAWSSRAKRPFIPINCAAIPNELMESELFGYARGAFSGAVSRYDGQLTAATGGSVFLDEIDDTPMPIQVKLLRVLEDRVVSRLGENEWRKVDFRILAATNRDLRALIADGRFGTDLYERLAIVSVHLPPLRERVEDLPALAAHFIARFLAEEPAAHPAWIERPPSVSGAAMAALAAYPWPGNVRELRNAIFETLVYKRCGEEILLSDLPRRLLQRSTDAPAPRTSPDGPGGAEVFDRAAVAARIGAGTMNLRASVAALERAALEEALRVARGSRTEAARLLGEVGRGRAADPGSTVRAMMRRLGVDDGRAAPARPSRDGRRRAGPKQS